MNIKLPFFCALICFLAVFSSCEKDGGSTFLEGSYLLQTEEIKFKVNTTQYEDNYVECTYSLDVTKRTLTTIFDGQVSSQTISDDKEWIQFLNMYYEYFAGFPLGLTFYTDGTALAKLPDEWYTDVENWDLWFDKEDLDDWEFPLNYTIKGNSLSFSFLGIQGDGPFKIVSNTGNTLKLEQGKELLRANGEVMSEEFGNGFKVILSYAGAVYKKLQLRSIFLVISCYLYRDSQCFETNLEL